MIEPPYESKPKRLRIWRTVQASTSFRGRNRKPPTSHKEMTYGYGRLFRVVKRSYNERTRYLHSPRWRCKYGSW